MMCNSEKKAAMPSSKRLKAALPGRRASVAEDIMVEVLLRLPIKSIVRFRAVCRSWATLLSSEEFCRLHRAITRAAGVPLKLLHFSPAAMFRTMTAYSCSLAQGPRDDELLFTLDYARGKWVEVLTPASCHGLTLLYDALAKAYYICNAATRAVTRLPHSAAVASHWISTGLGFDARTREHKVVRLINGAHQSPEQDTTRCELYTPGGSHGDCWRPAAGGVPFGLRRFADSAVCNAVEQRLAPVFAKGFLHWLIQPYLLFKRPRGAIVYFSVMEETFSCVQSPPFLSPDFGPNPLSAPGFDLPFAHQAPPAGHLVEMDNQLYLVRDLRSNPHGSTLEIWRLLEYSSGNWSLDHRIDLSGHAMGRELREPQTVRVIGSIDSGRSGKKIILTTCKHKVHEKFEKKVHTYDLSSQDLETILSVTEASTSAYGFIYDKPLPSRFGLFEDCLAPMHKTDEEIALSSTLSKAVKEILLRLPAKSVAQSKLICKQWLRLIKSESFIRSYFEHKNMGRSLTIMLVGKGTGQSAFCFAPLDTWLSEAPNHCALLDTKVVCSKPCHGMNLVSTATNDYLYNPGTGFHRVYRNPGPQMYLALGSQRINAAEKHAFAVGGKNVGLTFDPLSREHVIVEIVYHQKNFHSRGYRSVCELRWCNSTELAHEYLVPLPPLPVNDMPPAYVGGVLYWMSDPRLGRSYERAIVSFDISTRLFDTIHCPSCITVWSKRSPCSAFVVELQGALCAVLADPVTNSLDIWRLERGRCIWGRAWVIRLEASPDYSLVTNVVVPLAVDPKDGGILLNTGRKLGVYDPLKQTIKSLYSQDQLPLATSAPHLGVPQRSKFTSLEDNSALDSEILPLVPMVYEESLACYPVVGLPRWLSFC
ncbi:uncharacterized protein [Lolium perenne]|uniref:uncharacterized protein n=1 Tax=Lolium perenne TaxID=4522 RepID=UPI0021EB3DBB|nr:uncharacterized protein LOC127327462 [Lolium perenne]XP_051210193.1 uncharacterized protein LOC127327462 [Lolium perenne]